MLARTGIVDELVRLFKQIDGVSPYNIKMAKVQKNLKFWDEVDDFPYTCVVAGSEQREYLPSNFTWGFLLVNIKVYVKGEDPEKLLAEALEDIEKVIDDNNELAYDSDDPTKKTEDIRILSIETDEGLLVPFGVGDITAQIRFEKL
jgi:translation elongation factor EF-1beta